MVVTTWSRAFILPPHIASRHNWICLRTSILVFRSKASPPTRLAKCNVRGFKQPSSAVQQRIDTEEPLSTVSRCSIMDDTNYCYYCSGRPHRYSRYLNG